MILVFGKVFFKMKVFGFNQIEAVNLGLKVNHLLVLSWFLGLQNDKMITREVNGDKFYLIYPPLISEDLPILNVKKLQAYNIFKRLVEVEVLEHFSIKSTPNFNFYKLGKNFNSLLKREGC
jgi:hypothetical protein